MTRHVHSWHYAPDWEPGPGLAAQECTPCRGLRFMSRELMIANDPTYAESAEGQAYLEEHRKAERKRREWERRTAGRIR